MHRMGPNRRQNPGPAHAAAGINPLVVEVGSAVIGSGAHMAMVAMVDNADREENTMFVLLFSVQEGKVQIDNKDVYI